MRRQFALPSNDVAYLESTGLEWETVVTQEGARYLIIRDRPVPAGYSAVRADVALMIPPSYPESQIDMSYFHPHLARSDGKAIGRLTPHKIDQVEFQRWSRHRTKEAPWRPGEDDVSTHLVLVDDWLEREFAKP